MTTEQGDGPGTGNPHIGASLDSLFEELGELDEVRALTFWRKCSPAQRLLLLRTASSIATPWEERELLGEKWWIRRGVKVNTIAVPGYVGVDDRESPAYDNQGHVYIVRDADDKDIVAAREIADEELREDGWELLDEGWDRP